MSWRKSITKVSWILAAGLILTLAVSGTGLAKDFEADFMNKEFSSFPGEGTSVKPARASWGSGFFLEALYSRALEHLGYDLEHFKELSNPIFYKAVVQHDVDFWANGWFPLHNDQLPEEFDEMAQKIGYVVKNGALQGYLVSKEHADKYDITSLEDFKREKVKEAFDANGDGKADLVACPPGWGCEKVITHHMDVYKMHNHINAIKAAYAASMADAVARYNNGEPVLFYTWTPNWTVNKLKPGKDVVWINVPSIIPTKGQRGMEDDMVAEGVKGAVTDPVKMGFVANDIRVVANNEFLNNNPAAKKLFELMAVPFDDIAAQNSKMFEGEDDQEDIERHATEWIMNHKDQWIEWQRKARMAAE
jgi:glycine betaine/proline transport system substrate-binding protein